MLGIADLRGAQDWNTTLGRLTTLHYGLAAAVVIVYWLIGVVVARGTPGQALHWAMRGTTVRTDRARVWRTLGPALLLTSLLALYAGMTLPTIAGANTAGSSTGPAVATEQPAVMPPDAPTTSGDDRGDLASEQADAVDAVLQDSVMSRTHLGSAITEVDACGDVASALTALRRVARERQSQRERAQGLAVDSLPDGPALQQALVDALTYSGDADDAYAAWAQHVVNAGCGRDGNWSEGNRLSENAQTAKRDFVRLWNPVATQFGLPTRTTGDI
jgi:hypothetical protein